MEAERQIMRKLKQWLYEKFLPAWCRDELMQENICLQGVVRDLKQENARLNAYINGMHDAMRGQRRVTINTGEVKRE